MGFKTGNFPPVDPQTFLQKPLLERVKALALHWVEYGFGTPKMVHTVYVTKLLVLYVAIGTSLVTWTSHCGPPWDVGGWWDQPIVYEKAILWTVLLEVLNLAGSWGPIAGKFKPMLGGVLFYARVGTIRMRPWKAVPFTNGQYRTPVDVALYLGLLASLVTAIVVPAGHPGSLHEALPNNTTGLIKPGVLIAPIVLLVLCGLRDKTIFLAARAEQYLPPMIFFAVLDFTNMIVALKIAIVIVWLGAGISKFGHHFTAVVAPMVSNAPTVLSKRVKRWHYRDFPNDVRPSKVAGTMAHVGGTCVELIVPLVLLFSTNSDLTRAAITVMVIFHIFIILMFPLAVPLEWNVLFGYAVIFLFWGFPNQDGYGVGDMSNAGLTVAVIAGSVFFPILGNLRPDLVSFLPSMRQYAGNWASALWCFAPGAEDKLNLLTRPCKNNVQQLEQMGYPPEIAEITMQQTIAFRSLHSQGRGLFSLLLVHVADLNDRIVREGEFACNSVLGFNFGDGHLHSKEMIAAIQTRCQFAPGEFVVAWVESQPIHKPTQAYEFIDAALGVVERGTWVVSEAVNEQPWLPNGPVKLTVTWTREGYVRAGNYGVVEPEVGATV